MSYIKTLGEHLTLVDTGGKAVNLSLLVNAGFNIPEGFVITTKVYNEYVTLNVLQGVIDENLTKINLSDIETLNTSSNNIRDAFRKGKSLKVLENNALTSMRN